ncbi:MAG: hypothetical protein ACRDL7_11950, partial [Gaiellaceae bacterium]
MVPAEEGAVVAGFGRGGIDGMPFSLTDLLDRLAETEDELSEERGERRKLELYLNRIKHDIEAKTPIIRAQRREYELALKGQEVASARLSDALADAEDCRKRSDELQAEVHILQRDQEEIKRENEDLARQVQALLRSRMMPGNRSSSQQAFGGEEEGGPSDLVEFGSVEEMQIQNQRMFRELHRLTKKVTGLERHLDQDKLRNSLNIAEEELSQQREERDRQVSLVAGIVQQRDLYRALLAKADSNYLRNAEADDGTTDRETAIVIAGGATSPTQNLSSKAVAEELNKLRADMVAVRGEKSALEERVSRLDIYCSDLTATADKMRSELISAEGGRARSDAEVAFLKNRCERLEVRVEEARAESKRM